MKMQKAKGLPTYIGAFFVLFLIILFFAQNTNGKIEVGETLNYSVIFGGILKGNAKIKFYGKIASFVNYETLFVLTEDLREDSSLRVFVDSTIQTLADTTQEKTLSDSISEISSDSLTEAIADSVKVIKTLVTNVYYITYETHFVGNIYNVNADIYATDNFLPLLIETKINRTGKTSRGKELFFPDRRMAIFSQSIENKQEADTIFRKHPLQDITTLPFYLMNVDFGEIDTVQISLAQGEIKLYKVGKQEVIIGEDNYNTDLIESESKELKVWLNRKDKLPIKVVIEEQKIKMHLIKKEIDKSIESKLININKEKIKTKLSHILNNM